MATDTKPAALWGGMTIPIIVISGEVNAGKSLFAPLIDPACRITDGSTEPTTIVFDQEGSVETYHGSLNFKWFDTRAAVFRGIHRNVMVADANDPKWLRLLKTKADVNDSPAASMFRAVYLSLLSIEPGKYRVGAFDTFTPIQEGMIDWLRKHPEAFGRTANQYEKASSMFLWPDAKAMLAHILAVDCRLRFETVVLTAHMKAKWEGDRKTKDRIAEGLDVLDKMATLHIRLERTPDSNGNVPKEPVGILMKERLLRFGLTPAEDRPILPPRIEKCTPDTIRAWIEKPANYEKLKKSERAVIAPPPSELELQQARLAAAEAEAEAATAKTALLERQSQRQKELAAIRQAAPQVGNNDAEQAEAAQQKAEAEATAKRLAELDAQGKRLMADNQKPVAATNGRVEQFKRLLPASKIDPEKIRSAMQSKGVSRFTELAEADQDALLTVLQKAANAKAATPEPAAPKN